MKLYFYRLTIQPKDDYSLKYYDHSRAVAGFDKEKDHPLYIGHMTMNELAAHMAVQPFGVPVKGHQRREKKGVW